MMSVLIRVGSRCHCLEHVDNDSAAEVLRRYLTLIHILITCSEDSSIHAYMHDNLLLLALFFLARVYVRVQPPSPMPARHNARARPYRCGNLSYQLSLTSIPSYSTHHSNDRLQTLRCIWEPLIPHHRRQCPTHSGLNRSAWPGGFVLATSRPLLLRHGIFESNGLMAASELLAYCSQHTALGYVASLLGSETVGFSVVTLIHEP